MRVEPERFLVFLSEQTRAATREVLVWQSERDRWAPRALVERVCQKHYARMAPVMAITSGRLQRGILGENDRIAVQRGRYASIHDGVGLALDPDDSETIAALAIYRTQVHSGERSALSIGRKVRAVS